MPRHIPANAEPEADTVHYSGAEGGWGSMRGMALVERTALAGPSAGETLARQNKPGGFMCVSCSWAKPPNPHVAEFCENGAKATIWDLTSKRCTPSLFEQHTVRELADGAISISKRSAGLPIRCATTARATAMSRRPGTRPSPPSALSCASWTRRTSPSIRPARQAWRRPISMRCSRASTAATICPTAPTCVTRRPRSASRKCWARRSAPARSRISKPAT